MVYLIDFETCYKIGRTTDLKRRMSSFKTARENVRCLDLIIKPGVSIDVTADDKKIESGIHSRCKRFNITGELFQKCEEVVQTFKTYKLEVGDTNNYQKAIEDLFVTKEIVKSDSKQSEETKIVSSRGKITFQYSLNGEFIAKYNSRTEAEQALNIYSGKIKEAVNGRHLTAGGFIWSNHLLSDEEIKDKLNTIKKSKLSKLTKSTRLNQYTLSGELIKSWNTMTEAGTELGIAVSSISLCCKGKYKKAGGFVWKIE